MSVKQEIAYLKDIAEFHSPPAIEVVPCLYPIILGPFLDGDSFIGFFSWDALAIGNSETPEWEAYSDNTIVFDLKGLRDIFAIDGVGPMSQDEIDIFRDERVCYGVERLKLINFGYDMRTGRLTGHLRRRAPVELVTSPLEDNYLPIDVITSINKAAPEFNTWG